MRWKVSSGVKGPVKQILRKLGLFDAAGRLYLGIKGVGSIRRWWNERRLRIWAEESGLPIPPPDLLFLVAGTNDVRWFLHSGQLAFEAIQDVLRRTGAALDGINKILDFGCGCGRVVRHWNGIENANLFGTDYNPKLVAWCCSNLPFATFGVNDLSPPLSYETDEFDLVYALSVFTHLPERLQATWMRELRRVIVPGGYLLITTHGLSYLDNLSPAEREEFQKNRLIIQQQEAAGSNQCTTFHPEEYVRDKLAKGFEVLDFIPEGAKGNPRQDVYLLQKLSGGDRVKAG